MNDEEINKAPHRTLWASLIITVIVVPVLVYVIKLLDSFNFISKEETLINVLLIITTFVTTLFSLIFVNNYKFTKRLDESLNLKLKSTQDDISDNLNRTYEDIKKLKNELNKSVEENFTMTKEEISIALDNTEEFIKNKLDSELSNKLYRKLVQTNAVIKYPDQKISLTAKKVSDFPDKSEYKGLVTDPNNTETIDVVRFLSYQNFLFTPEYLTYLFDRHKGSNITKKIIVVHEPTCQATITFALLCYKIGYQTALISGKRFKEFYVNKLMGISSSLPNDEATKEQISNTSKLLMIKGNPFMFKDKNKIGGKFTNYRKKIENNGEINPIPNDESYWSLLQNLFENSYLIEDENELLVDSLEKMLSKHRKNPLI